MALPYQISFSADEACKMAKQANERIKETVSFYVNHFYKLILAKMLVGEFTVQINFKKLDEEKDDKCLKEGTIVRVSRSCDAAEKCLGPFSDFRNGIITSVLWCEGIGTRYLIKVIGEKACALSDMPTNVYDSEKTYLRALFPGSKQQIFRYGNGFPIVNGKKLHSMSSTLYSKDELEVGSFEERYQIITQTMGELESLLGITIIKSGPYSLCSSYEGKLADYSYKITWKSEEEQKKDVEKEELGGVGIRSECFPSDEEYAKLYDLHQVSSTPEKELHRLGLFVPDKEAGEKKVDKQDEAKPKPVEEAKNEGFPNVKLADLIDWEAVPVLEEALPVLEEAVPVLEVVELLEPKEGKTYIFLNCSK